MKTTLPLSLILVLAMVSSAESKPPPKAPAAAAPAATDKPAAPECAAMGPLPDTWSGQAYAIDGDTLAGIGLKSPLRVWGIQAPELRDADKSESVPGMRARAALEDLLDKSDHKLKCRPVKFDRECRIVAQCSIDAGADSIDIGGAQLAAGMAYGLIEETPAHEPRASQRYATAEFEARKARRGLWPVWLGGK